MSTYPVCGVKVAELLLGQFELGMLSLDDVYCVGVELELPNAVHEELLQRCVCCLFAATAAL